MTDFDPYATIEHVMNDTVDSSQKRYLDTSTLMKVNFVAVLTYGRHRCKVIPRAEFVILQSHDVYSMYSQSIPIPLACDWLCHELLEPIGPYQDIATLALAYFAILNNHKSTHERVIDPSMVRQDVLRYSLFYYLLHVDSHMNHWATIHVRECNDNRVRFVYSKSLDYLKQLSEYQGHIDMHLDEISPTDPFLESFLPMISIVASLVTADFKTSLDID
jgi:hypothetical protein